MISKKVLNDKERTNYLSDKVAFGEKFRLEVYFITQQKCIGRNHENCIGTRYNSLVEIISSVFIEIMRSSLVNS